MFLLENRTLGVCLTVYCFNYVREHCDVNNFVCDHLLLIIRKNVAPIPLFLLSMFFFVHFIHVNRKNTFYKWFIYIYIFRNAFIIVLLYLNYFLFPVHCINKCLFNTIFYDHFVYS
uniref:SJCHGC09594 protein n=1 Tax=Schistosoma japonicum TaxID=6182 RepID=Q5DE76_SCHJA|nr:SJCHGC09594 protein [Schistosoma japonicum]